MDGVAVELSEEQINDLERKIGQLPTIKKLKENDNKIIKELEGLKVGYNELDKDMKEGFAKGKETMSWHSEKISALDIKVDKMESSIKEFIRLQNREVIDEVRSDKLKRLEDMLHKKDEELKSKKEFADKIKTGVILLSVSSLIAYVAWTTKVFIGKA